MNQQSGRGRPQVLITTDSVAQASAYQQLLDDEEKGRQWREARRLRKRLARNHGVAEFCSRCGRRWGAHYVSRKALFWWVLATGIVAWVLGAQMVFLGIVHLR